MSNSIISDDALNGAMLNGIYKGFRDDLTARLRLQAEEVIEQVVNEMCKRVKLKIESGDNYLFDRKDINLSWCIKREVD